MSDAADFDDDDWTDLERSTKRHGDDLPDVSIRLSAMGRESQKTRVVARISFRRRAGELIFAAEPRFRVQIGGPKLNKIRIIKDHLRGSHECHSAKGTATIGLGHVNAWPNEIRDPVACSWSGDPSGPAGMVLVLPEDWAKAKPAPVVPAAAPVSKPPMAIVRRPLPGTSYSFGDPPPGRSALDKQRSASK